MAASYFREGQGFLGVRSIYGEGECSSDCFPIEQFWSSPNRDYSDTVIPTKLVSIGCESTCVCSNELADLEQRRSNETVLRMRRRCRVGRMFQDQVGGLDGRGYETDFCCSVPEYQLKEKGEREKIAAMHDGRDGFCSLGLPMLTVCMTLKRGVPAAMKSALALS